ncbi:MBL fold metallo-hydrolase [Paenibacillus barcinonensis]|uniref:MBL fold metallo-hydrolase n=1 Tax=Paenibacillus barcinonensis TaxID=198119 RepID=A0A2V4VWN9_PAEBA|nr:MBL fold metallo-hydrolase [Paenibacillus barcinonensis]PYE43295.1 metallo-beta-lactamase superfamily protein [Paenibacillus barcinonensis]QKS55575.1 MBL fold metallo-hydrolase [Paenibacillus barcinonensis]
MNFFIEMIDVGIGDSYIINMKNENGTVRILVDGGSERKIKNVDNIINMILPHQGNGKKLNGIIVTHIDDDHIGGILKLLNHPEVEQYIDFTQECFIIFNDLVDPATISYNQGVRLKKSIDKFPNLSLVRTYEQNKRYEINGLEIFIRGTNKVDPIDKGKDIVLIDILLPIKDSIRRLMKKWNDKKKDPKLINESSLSFIVKYRDKTILIPGDNYYSSIINQLDNIIKPPSSFDLIMLAHHGANANNEKLVEFIELNKCEKIMLPLSKATTHHPNTNLINRILEHPQNQLFCPVGLQLPPSLKEKNQIVFGQLIEI